jgi:hypothetical protein
MTNVRRHNLARLKSASRLTAAAPVALTLLLLGGAAADKVMFHLPPSDVVAYHARVRQAAAEVPFHVGPWLGTDTPVPSPAVAPLRPTVVVSRQYQDVRTGRTASLLIVQCEDARDLLGHYPPVWYEAHGWSRGGAAATERQVDGGAVPITVYTFASARVDAAEDVRIDNFIILPDGQIRRDLDAVEATAGDDGRRFFGAAQVQVITDAQWGDSDRDEVFRRLIGAAGPLLRTIRSGATR